MAKVITGIVRFSYANVFEPTSVEAGGTLKYNISLLIPKSDKATVKKITDAIEEAKKEGLAKLGNKIPPTLKIPMRDGDLERPEDENYAGHFFINASSINKPGLVDQDLNPIMDKKDFYSGCFGRASLNFYAFNTSGNKGIACGLNNLQKTMDGENLSGGSSAEQDFGDEDDLN
jgi:hypothetical protein